MVDPKLTPTAYIVLGLIDRIGEATPYQLKQAVAASVGHFWSLPHSQLYAEPARLAELGYLTDRQEPSGRRRKRYALTARGREVMRRWTETPTEELTDLRDLAVLKLFFGGDPARLAAVQVDALRRRLVQYKALRAMDTGDPPRGPWLALDAGIAHLETSIRFWSEHAGAPDPSRSDGDAAKDDLLARFWGRSPKRSAGEVS